MEIKIVKIQLRLLHLFLNRRFIHWSSFWWDDKWLN